MYDRVVTINNTHLPAYRKPGATLVDLRMFDSNDRSPEPRLVHWEMRLPPASAGCADIRQYVVRCRFLP
jgi:hypothetical protein